MPQRGAMSRVNSLPYRCVRKQLEFFAQSLQANSYNDLQTSGGGIAIIGGLRHFPCSKFVRKLSNI